MGRHVSDIQTNHAALTEHINPFNELFRYGAVASTWAMDSTQGLAALEAEINRQSVMIAYNNAFFATFVLSLALIPVVLLFRRTRQEPPAPVVSEIVPAGADR